MYSEALQALDGVAIFPLIGLVLFFLGFGTVIVWVSRLDRQLLDRMAHIPLDRVTSADTEGEAQHE